MNNTFLARAQEEELVSLASDSRSVCSNSPSVDKAGDVEKETDVRSVTELSDGVSASGHSGDDSNGDDGSVVKNTTMGDEDKALVDGEEKNPWSKSYVGIPINYFSVGLIYGGSVSVLYPILIVQHGVTSAFYSASASLVTLFWSYKIIFGILCDCFPIRGQKWKPYIVIGWALCALMLVVLASMGEDVSPVTLVIMLTFANLGYVAADVAADGFMVWMAHHEPEKRRGKIQSLIYITRSAGKIAINLLIIFAFSGPAVACPGYEADPNVSCTDDEAVTSRNTLFEEDPENWCHQVCPSADFAFGLTIPQFAWIIGAVNLASMPSYFFLHEGEKTRERVREVLGNFWTVMQRRAVWQVMLYTMVSSITFNVFIAAKTNANYTWLSLSTAQNQILTIMESVIFMAGLTLVRQYGLNFSWRKMIWIGSILVTVFNLLYLLVVFDIVRNPWFYIFTDVTDTFMYTLNFTASVFAIVEVSEPGFEAITYALITTANNATIPLSVVISYQFMALFPRLNTQEGLAEDTPEVRKEFGLLILIVEVINLSSLFALPMLPRQKKETQELVAKGETSSFWAKFTLISGTVFLIYSTVSTFLTVAGADSYGCYKILGGGGCSDNESDIPVYVLMAAVFLYCYGVNFYFTFWPILTGKEQFSFSMFF